MTKLKYITYIIFYIELFIIILGKIDYLFSREDRTTFMFDYISALTYSFLIIGILLLILNSYLTYIIKSQNKMPVFISLVILLLPLLIVSLLLSQN